MVEYVVGFGTELELDAFDNWKVFEDGQIDKLISRADQAVSLKVAKPNRVGRERVIDRRNIRRFINARSGGRIEPQISVLQAAIGLSLMSPGRALCPLSNTRSRSCCWPSEY